MAAVWWMYIPAVYVLPLSRFVVISLFSWKKPPRPAGHKQTSPELWSELRLHTGDINSGKPQVPGSHPNLCLGSVGGFALTLLALPWHYFGMELTGVLITFTGAAMHICVGKKSPKASANSASANEGCSLEAAQMWLHLRGKSFRTLNLSDMWGRPRFSATRPTQGQTPTTNVEGNLNYLPLPYK